MSISSYYDGTAARYSEQYQEENLLTHDTYPANYFRLQMLFRRLQEVGATSLFEFGAGEATPLITMAEGGMRVAGFDISPKMVEVAQANLAAHGLDPQLVVHADAEDDAALDALLATHGTFDAVMALGVIPHVKSDEQFLGAMSRFLNPGGRILLEFRNSLFSLFTFNRYTKELVLDELLVGVDASIKDTVARSLDSMIAVDKPPLRLGTEDAPGYDAILSRFHNPFELAETVRKHGFEDVQFHWYHYHPAPPMLESEIGRDAFRRAAFALEHEGTWRGMFLCSAGVIEAVKR